MAVVITLSLRAITEAAIPGHTDGRELLVRHLIQKIRAEWKRLDVKPEAGRHVVVVESAVPVTERHDRVGASRPRCVQSEYFDLPVKNRAAGICDLLIAVV